MASGEPTPPHKSEATFFKEEIEAAFSRYRTMTVYEAIGALKVVKANLLERLGKLTPPNQDDY